MLKRSTWIWLALAVAIAGGTVVYEAVSSRQEEQQTEAKRIFGFEESQVQSITIATDDRKLTLTRSPETAPTASPGSATDALEAQLKTRWQVEATAIAKPQPSPSPQASPSPQPSPQATPSDPRSEALERQPASDAAVAFLLNQLTTGQRDREVTVAADELGQFGLDNPAATVTLTLQDGKTHTLLVGNASFDDRFLYSRIDPQGEPREIAIALIPKDLDFAINRPLREWKAEASAAAESSPPPEASPSPEAAPSPEASPSPEPSPSPETSPSPSAP